MESKLVLHTKTRHINVYAHPENVTHLTKEKMGTLNLQGGTAAYVKQFIDEHNQDESAHPYIQESISTLEGTVTEHIEDTSNPHSVTKEQVGLGNVDNTADLDKPISTATQAALDGKQATISDLATIRSGAALGATAVQPGDLATVATTGSYNDLTNKPTIPSQASDVHALPDTTKYGASLEMSVNSSTFVVTTTLKDQDGNTLGTAQTIDLPLESVVVGGSYDDATKKVVLTLQNGSTVEFSVADLVAGLQSEITSSNKLSADLVDDTNTAHKFVTASDKSTWNGKQDAISDLATIRSGAAAGATALQPSVAASTYATKAEIADQYTKSNLLPKVPVAFEKAQVSDLYTVVGSPTITNGVASGFSSSNYLSLDTTTFSSNNSFKFVVKAKLNSFGKAVFGFNQPWTNIFLARQDGMTWWFSSQTTGASQLNVKHTTQLQTSTWYYFLFSYDGNSTYSIGVSTDGQNFEKTSYTSSSKMGVSSKIMLGSWTQSSYQFDGEIDFNSTYIKVNGKYFVPPLSSSTIVSVSTMTGATSSAAGASGLVPAPAAGDETKFLRGDGTWVGSTSSTAWGNITGTLSDQTDLQNALNAKQDTISDLATIRSGASAGATAVQPSDLSQVECIVETYSNGTSWYRVWSDGWCEQGGYVDSGVGSVASGSQVTFLKAFADTNYTITFLSSHSDTSTNNLAVQYGNYYYGCYYPSSKATTGIMLRGQGTWKAEGYIA